jgi:coiled-coil domain-containing protein 61
VSVCADIEEMSLKTGNFKKFSLFVRMLSSALGSHTSQQQQQQSSSSSSNSSSSSSSSSSVFIDLLTFQDLEALKARKQQQQQQQQQIGGAPSQQPLTARTQQAHTAAMAQAQNKRYVILTYVAEFDKSVFRLRFGECLPGFSVAAL